MLEDLPLDKDKSVNFSYKHTHHEALIKAVG